jgi:ribosomal protein S8
VIEFAFDLQQVNGFLRVLWFPPPKKSKMVISNRRRLGCPKNITHLRKFAEKLPKEKRGQGIGIEATTLVVMCTDCRDKFN